ncbi:hypothetical protein SDRG_04960 [Saprolegnia diclina VS20]|uniref:VWFA domain-containing protein n=1 Tax=Saprolegnia diclina (strain VS20) TaxID=1156394 RepID=T0RZ63_SAPDV|nr:hypothetical protein SDRG_04960 [Saprolegnia diclina VS20]EQC37943.1 hypothetical protein SDRG_04960 [Saprolegnia diclina VS20]|eukprot:XP_008608876.1 hypothetical protein SDRG_04960 [Saprolegnia diclina VS20]
MTLGVATSYESMSCYQLLRMSVESDDGSIVFQPTLVESELLRLLRALGVVDVAMNMRQDDQLGHFVNASGDDGIDVVACFGKQAAVEAELRARGWWPSKLEKYLAPDHEGVYAIRLAETRPKVVLFTWLVARSFEPAHLRERATYALRFVTTLTPTVLCCLTEADWTALELAASETRQGARWKKYSVAFSIKEATVQKEMVACDVLGTMTLLPTGQTLVPATGATGVTLSTSVAHDIQSKHDSVATDNFAAWLVEMVATHRIELRTAIPRPLMKAALQAWDAFPEAMLGDVTLASLQDQFRADVAANVAGHLRELEARCLYNAAFLFYIADEPSEAAEIRAHTAMVADFALLKEHISSAMQLPMYLYFAESVGNAINVEYWQLLRTDPHLTGKKTFAQAAMGTIKSWFGADAFVALTFPFLSAANAAPMRLILPKIRNALQSHHDHWCRDFKSFLHDKAVFDIIVGHVVAIEGPKKDHPAELRAIKEEIVHEAFVSAIREKTAIHNGSSAMTTAITSASKFRVSFSKQYVAGGATMLQLTPLRGAALAKLKLPLKASVVFVAVVGTVVLVVFTIDTKTYVRAYQSHGPRAMTQLHTKQFPHLVECCDFDVTHRMLGLLHSTCKVELFAFNESYKLLERVHQVNLVLLRPPPPYTQLFVFGGDNHGVFCVGDDGSAQSYFLRTQQLSKHVPQFVATPDTKVLKLHDGAFVVCLVPDADGVVRVQTLMTHDHAPLPETELTLPTRLNWPATHARAYADTIVLLDPTTSVVVELTMTVVTGKVAWQLQCAQEAVPATAGEAHVLWALFHVFEKFPVRALMDDEGGLLPHALQLHVHADTPARRNVLSVVLDSVMAKLLALNKDLSPLSLNKDAVLGSESLVWPTMALAPWLLELVGFVPVPICRAHDNQLVLLRDGVAATFTDGSEAHTLAPQIGFGPASHVLHAWSGPVVVLTSMGKQSTGKSYFLNHLTGSSFAISGARCTDGVWLTLRRLGRCLVVVLDFEGLGSFERSAQEDTFLSVLNAAISRLTVFRIEMRFDKDIDGMFAKFQQGVALLKGDERLFRGQLYLNAKDVNPNDQASVVAEFESKLAAILSENTADNFVSAMYGGDVVITCCPPLGNKGYYEALAEAAALLVHARDTKAYVNGHDFHECLSMVLAKIALLDWTSMEDNVQAHKSVVSRQHIRYALRHGILDDGTSLGPNYDVTMTAQFEAVVPEPEMVAPIDDTLDFGLDLNEGDVATNLATAKATLLLYLQRFLDHVDEPRTVQQEARFDAIWGFVVWRREYRVRLWFESLGVASRDERDGLDACVLKTKQFLRRCQHTCARCKLGCFESFLHEADVAHDCGTNHKCQGHCAYCLTDTIPCGAAAGHAGACNCSVLDHTCPAPCAMASASNCDGGCHLPVDHDGDHTCSVALHCCGDACAAPNCRSLCTQPFALAHAPHHCGANRCQQLCSYADCGNGCAADDHFHAPDALHACGKAHLCAAECAVEGMCEVKVQLEKTTETFHGARSTFEYTHQAMNGGRKKCAAALPTGRLDHAGVDHQCTTAVHTCTVRCPCCQYYCEKAFGHADLHKTSHGNMKETYFVSDSASVDIDGRQYTAGERGVAEMCPFFCAKMGRGHVHYVTCDATSAANCVYATSDGRRHCTVPLEPHPKQPMDEVLHETYWKLLGWEDPVTSAVERAAFGLCPFQCDAPDHKVDDPSYCVLDAWHVPSSANDALAPGHTRVQGHVFNCKHYAGRGLDHHVFVLDASGSMSGQPWLDVTAAVHAYLAEQRAKKGPNCADIVSVVTFSSRGRIEFEARSMDEMAQVQIPFQGQGTDFDTGLRCAIEVLSRNQHARYTPVVLFFSDGYPNTSSSGVYLAQHIATTFGRHQLLSFLVGFGQMNFVCLEQLAVHMQGTFHNAVSGIDLLETFKQISVAVHLKTGLVCKAAPP